MTANNRKYGIDAYLIVPYSEEHPRYSWTKSDLLYWNDWFTKSSIKKGRKRYPKGYIQITYQ